MQKNFDCYEMLTRQSSLMLFVPVDSLSIRLIFVPVGAADCQYFFSFDRNGTEQIRIANLCLKMIRGAGN